MLRFIDFETRDEGGRLKDLGTSKYTQQREFTLLCLASKVYGKKPTLWLPGDPFPDWAMNPDPKETWVAHNATFERLVWANYCVRVLGWDSVPLSKWMCTAARCRAMGLPGSLEESARALGLPTQKDMEGHRLMLKYTKQRKVTKTNPDKYHDDPTELKKVFDYCVTDVEVTEQIHDLTHELTDEEMRVWRINEMINDYGFQIDIKTCTRICQLITRSQERALDELVKITGGKIKTNGPQGYIDYLDRLDLPNMQAPTVAEALEREDLTKIERRVLEIRQTLAQTAVKKFKRFINRVEDDGRIRGTHMYHTASTGRFSSHGVQTQNMKRGHADDLAIKVCADAVHIGKTLDETIDLIEWQYGNVTDAVSNIVRGMIVARDGGYLCPMDFSSIEARVSAWLANEQTMLDQFRADTEVYCIFASKLFDFEVTKKDKLERFIGKQCILGLSYGLGHFMFRENTLAIAKNMGMTVDLSPEFCKEAVALYREEYAMIPQYWNDLETAAIEAVKHPGKITEAGMIRFGMERFKGNEWLRCKLPSGRIIRYPSPRVVKMWPSYVKRSERTAENEWKKKYTLTFLAVVKGQNRREKIIRLPDEEYLWQKDSPYYTAHWQRLSTWGGTLLENVTQGLSRDYLTHSMDEARKQRFAVSLHVHDEIVADVKQAHEVEKVRQVMLRKPEWGKLCPIDADGFVTKRYRKD